MVAEPLVLPKPAYNVLRRLTGESRPDVALSLALQDLVRLKLHAARSKIGEYERKYGMTFGGFEESWKAGNIPDAHSHAVEKDYWEWEAAESDAAALVELGLWLV